MNFRIEKILIRDVAEYAASIKWEHAKTIPITLERARSQQKNPNALPDDPCLWVALSEQNDEVIGFCGTLPGKDFINNTRMGWNSCWWVDQDKGREAAMPLFYRFLQAWDYRVAFADMTPHTMAIVKQMGFCSTSEDTLVHSYIRLSWPRFVSRLGKPGILIYPLLGPSVLLVNVVQRIRIALSVRKRGEVQVEFHDRLDHELYGFIQKHREFDFTRYSMEVFRWMEENPWLVEYKAKPDDAGYKYPFSYLVKQYSLKWLVSRRNGEISSVSLVSVRDGSLKVLYLFHEYAKDATSALISFISSEPWINSLIYAHPDLIPYHKEFRPVVLYSSLKKLYRGVSLKICPDSDRCPLLQMGDGDVVFT